MSKNEVHARVSSELMEALRRICNDKSTNLSDVVRAALVLYVDVYECPNLFERHNLLKSNEGLEIGLIGTSLETTKATPDLLDQLDKIEIGFGLKVANDDIESERKNDSIIQLIEQEFQVFFARYRDEYDPEDGQLYWFWLESENKSSWQFDPDSPNNQCPVKRFKSREEAIKDCLRERLPNPMDNSSSIKTVLPPVEITDELSEENIIEW
jgi:hypothetical protein